MAHIVQKEPHRTVFLPVKALLIMALLVTVLLVMVTAMVSKFRMLLARKKPLNSSLLELRMAPTISRS